VSGKDQGSDLDQDKVTYPAIVGLQESKIKAQELALEAQEKLQPLVKNTDNLCRLADYIVSRKT
jgi:geranylgeranyl pyrophosphate synthase